MDIAVLGFGIVFGVLLAVPVAFAAGTEHATKRLNGYRNRQEINKIIAKYRKVK